MKSFDESELIAYHFHELAPRRELEIRQMLETDADAGAEFDAIGETLRAFRDYGPAPAVDAAVVERNWQAIRTVLPYIGARPVKAGWRRALRGHPMGVGLAGLSVAGLVAAGVMLLPARRVARSASGGVGRVAAVAPSPVAGGLPVVGDLHGRKVVAERINGRPGPLTTEPVESGESGVKDALLFAPVKPEVSVAPWAMRDGLGHSSSALGLNDGQAEMAATAQKQEAMKPGRLKASRSFRETDVAVGGFAEAAAFSAQNLGSGGGSRTLTSRLSVGGRASFHQQYKQWLGYEVAVGGTQTMFVYTYNDPSSGGEESGSIGGDAYELTGTYVVQGPRRKKVSSFVDVGGGMLAFVPTQPTQSISSNYQPAVVAGVGAEYHCNRHWGVRVEYHGMFLVGPNFNYKGSTIPVASHKMLSNEPTVSLTYHFGARDKD